jgi:O-acetyl-ADP-ribose deacetylase
MPAISAGIFGFPKDKNARIITGEIAAFLASEPTSLEEIDIYLMDPEVIGFFEKDLKNMGAGT